MEPESDKTYMVLVIITFLAFAAALGFAWAEWNELNDPTNYVDQSLFSWLRDGLRNALPA